MRAENFATFAIDSMYFDADSAPMVLAKGELS